MKKYVKPTMEYVKLLTEERLALDTSGPPTITCTSANSSCKPTQRH